jgi:hypothetical protein
MVQLPPFDGSNRTSDQLNVALTKKEGLLILLDLGADPRDKGDCRLSENVMASRVRLPETASLPEEPQLRRIRGEYLEMPGLRLTRPQAQRLWGLDEQTCVKLLDRLVDLKFLVLSADGNYMRLSEGNISSQALRMAKASISLPQSKPQSR